MQLETEYEHLLHSRLWVREGEKSIPLYFCKQLLYVFRAKDWMQTVLLLSNDIYIVYLNISESENSQDVNYWFYYNNLVFHDFS